MVFPSLLRWHPENCQKLLHRATALLCPIDDKCFLANPLSSSCQAYQGEVCQRPDNLNRRSKVSASSEGRVGGPHISSVLIVNYDVIRMSVDVLGFNVVDLKTRDDCRCSFSDHSAVMAKIKIKCRRCSQRWGCSVKDRDPDGLE